jgi:outer membrane receptor for ferrienterochelin and colicins
MLKFRFLFVLNMTVFVIFGAEAQTTAEESKVILEEIVITGTGTQHRLKDTPVPVEVITANDIKKIGATDFQQAMTMLAPSLSFFNNARGSNLVMNGLTNKYVLVLVNGKKLTGDTEYNVDLSRVDMTRIRRIEVLKGAGSALYGSDAIAGVINIITDEPDNLLTVSSNSKLEGYGQFTEGANLDITTKKIGSYTAYTHQQSDGWQLNHFDDAGKESWVMTSDHFYSNIFNQRFTLKPADALSFYAEGGYYDRLNQRPLEGYSYNVGYDSYNAGVGSKYDISQTSNIQLDLTYTNYDTRYEYTKESGDYKPGDVSLIKRQKYLNGHLKSVFAFTDNTQTVFGAEYINESLYRPDAHVDKNVYTLALYAQEEIAFWQDFRFVTGIRYTNHANSGSNVSPKASLMYQTKHFNIRGQYSAGFRAPGVNELYYYTFSATRGDATLTIGNRDLSAEKSHYGSLNLEYHNDWLNANITGYVNSLRDMVNSRTTRLADMSAEEQAAVKEEARPVIGDDVDKIRNMKKYANDDQAIVKGIEMSLNVLLGGGFSVGGNYVYADARTKDKDLNQWRNIERSIRHTGNVHANYIHTWKAYRLNVNLNGRLQSRRTHLVTVVDQTTNQSMFEDESAPGYGLWNLNTRHTINGLKNIILEPGIGVNNIFNKIDNRPYGVNYANNSPGRTFYASLLVRFNK